MKNSLLALALATGGLFTGLYAVSENRPVTIKAVVIPEPSKDFIGTAPEKPIPLTIKGNRDLPVFKNGVTEVKDIQPANVPYAPGIASILLLGGATWVYRAGTYTLKKNFPQYVQDIEDQAVAAKELAQIKKQNAALAIAHTNNAYRELAPELTPDQQADLEHLLRVQALRREQEILEEEIRVKKLRDALTGADKDKKEKTPKKQLLARLKEHEGGWLDTILRGNTPLVLEGAAGSGKTTFACCALMLKKLVYDCEPIHVGDLHGHKNYPKTWQYLLKVAPKVETVGFTEKDGNDWDSYFKKFFSLAEFFNSVIPGAKDAPNLAKTCGFLDEFTNGRKEAESRNILEQFSLSFSDVFTGSRKGQHFEIFGLHNFTTFTVPDKMYEQVRAGANRVQLMKNPDGTAALKGLWHYRDDTNQDVEIPISIPEWLNPESILEVMGVE